MIKCPVRYLERDEGVMDVDGKAVVHVFRHIGMTTSQVNEVGREIAEAVNAFGGEQAPATGDGEREFVSVPSNVAGGNGHGEGDHDRKPGSGRMKKPDSHYIEIARKVKDHGLKSASKMLKMGEGYLNVIFKKWGDRL